MSREVPHVCGYTGANFRKPGPPTCGGSYFCQGCERTVPNCFGAHDELGELCDDCAVQVWNTREALRRLTAERGSDG